MLKTAMLAALSEDEPGQSTNETPSKNIVTLASDFVSEQASQHNSITVTGEEKEKCLFFFRITSVFFQRT